MRGALDQSALFFLAKGLRWWQLAPPSWGPSDLFLCVILSFLEEEVGACSARWCAQIKALGLWAVSILLAEVSGSQTPLGAPHLSPKPTIPPCYSTIHFV